MVDALVSVVVEGLCAMTRDEVGLLVGVKKDLRKLSSSFTSIQAVLEDAENQQVTKKAVRDWLGKLKDVAYEMEDILEEWRIEALRSHGDNDDIHKHKKVLSCLQFPCIGFKQVELRHDIGHKIREITERLNEISTEKSSFNFNEASTSERPKMEERETGSLIDESEIFGRDDIKEKVINELVNKIGHEEESFSVVSIVGMGGLGKTTLAQLVYNDETIMKHFDQKRIWVCVSEYYDVNKILTKVIQSMGGSIDGNLDFDILQQSLNAIVGKKRFLLVLDDVWDGRLWGKLRVPLVCAAPGSRIVVTTRDRRVAEVMETTHRHDLGILSDSDCWKLFTSRAFRGMEEQQWPQGLTNVGKKIVDRCKGVPLAIRAVGSLLYFKRTKEEWQMVLESQTWEWKSLEGVDILPALLLSYYNLPIHLKQCLSFCSLFPKDYELSKDKLLKLWMAHGIIKYERREIEEIGETYFDDLLTRSLFQDAEKDEEGNIFQCKMHDLVHDLARSVTTGDYCVIKIRDPGLPSVNSHHLSLLVNRNVSSIPSPLCSAERLCTLLLFGSSAIKELPPSLFNHLKFLRALDLSRAEEIEYLPSSLGKLKHLRYLDLSGLNITELPESVTDLYNLQTLKLNRCERLCLLPCGISKMVNLRHLEIEGTRYLAFLPSGLGMLSSLRTLSKFPVGDENNRGCKIGELKNLNFLREILEIQNLEKVINPVEAREAELDKKCHLQRLSLECNDKTEEEWRMLGEGEMEKMERVFEGLRPPRSNLKVLGIQNYEGSKFPSWLEDARFSSLGTVELRNCKKCRLLPVLGKLPSLESLKLYEIDEIKVVGGDFYGKGRAFPKLKKLVFEWMSNWEEWKLTKEDGEVMPSLDELYISNCNKLQALPNCLPNTLRRVEIKKCSEVIWMPDNPLPLLDDLLLQGDVRGILGKPLPCLPALKKLQILGTSIESLPSVGWGLLESLNTLKIHYCNALASLPNGLGQLKALQTLDIYSCPRLSSLPEGLGQLEALQIVSVRFSYQLRSLFDGFEQLKSLHRLEISYCPKLRPLANLQHLTALEELRIDCCPLVSERLEKEKGEDWCNIAHIPCIWINCKRIQ